MPGSVPPVADEREGLLAYLAQQRYVLRVAAYGLTDEQARMQPLPFTQLSVGGLIKHVTDVERSWIENVQRRPRPFSMEEMERYDANFRMREDETLADVLAEYERCAADTEAVIAGIPDLGQPVPVPDAPWYPDDVTEWSVRWVLLHLIQETARHAGHADVVREAIDGATAFPLMAAIENWPPMPGLEPWRPATVGG